MSANVQAAPPLPRRPASMHLVDGPILPTLARLSLPNAVAMVATALVSVAETSYVGLLGIPALAGMALVFPMVMLQQMMSAGAMGGGVSSAVSRALGANNEERANQLAYHAAVIGLVFGLVFMVGFLSFGRQIFQALGGRDAPLEQALAYSNVAFIGATGVWLTNTLASVVRGAGNMKIPSVTLFGTALIQVVLGAGFGLGLGPLPRLGMPGIALGQVVAYFAGAVFLYWFLQTGSVRVRLSLRGNRLQRDMFVDILKVGALACISPLQSVATVLIVTRLVSRFGTEALAGYGIGTRLEFLLIPITFAIGVACVPMVGMSIGAGKVARARQVAWTGSVMAASIIGVLGILVAIYPDGWARLFTNAEPVVEAAHTYLRWAGPMYAFFGLGLCLYFASQGSGKILGPVLAASVRLLVIAAGGWWLTTFDAQVWMMFALVGLSMLAYGLSTALGVRLTSWGKTG